MKGGEEEGWGGRQRGLAEGSGAPVGAGGFCNQLSTWGALLFGGERRRVGYGGNEGGGGASWAGWLWDPRASCFLEYGEFMGKKCLCGNCRYSCCVS